MERIDLYINGINARKEWGLLTTPNTLSALLAPPSMKTRPTFTSRLEPGTRTDTENPQVAARDLNLEVQLTARTPQQFYERLQSFTRFLTEATEIALRLSDRPDVCYNLIYSSCGTFTQFCRGIATLSLKMNEPDPTDRTEHETDR